ncbi:MAG: hypothetical protein KGJ79_14850 [Alphaproteobacteria bacterium]|nr:hypothetical protein [Alphaproteobacteria bacterium]MDE2496125.1 hypothetical protein [Alphaproteobacteria bacterium]
MKNAITAATVAFLCMGCAMGSPIAENRRPTSPDRCVYLADRRIVYTGHTGIGLGKCLDEAHIPEIRELRITSHGGDAWQTLQVVERYSGKIDLVTVDRWCNSSCANYVIPAAKQLAVLPHSYVIVHGSLDHDAIQRIRRSENSQRHAFRREHPGIPVRVFDEAFQRMMAKLGTEGAAQDAFEKRRLSCRGWLHPTGYVSREVAEGKLDAKAKNAKGIVVTKGMAERCLKHTEILEYWSPNSQNDLPKSLRLKGAFLGP